MLGLQWDGESPGARNPRLQLRAGEGPALAQTSRGSQEDTEGAGVTRKHIDKQDDSQERGICSNDYSLGLLGLARS